MIIEEIGLEDCLQLRHEVLWPDLDKDACRVSGDDTAMHYGVLKDNVVVSCLSVFNITNNQCQIRKFATKQSCQGRGYGSALIISVLSKLAANNIDSVFLDARTSATGFYQRVGFQINGLPFMKNGIEYIRMQMDSVRI